MLSCYADSGYSGVYWEEVNVAGFASVIVADIQSGRQLSLQDKRLDKLGIKVEHVQEIYDRMQAEQEKIKGLSSELFGH